MLTLVSPLGLPSFFLFVTFSSLVSLFLLFLAVQPAVGTAANQKCICALSAIPVPKQWAHSVTAPAVRCVDSSHKQWVMGRDGAGGQVRTDWWTGRLSIQYLWASKLIGWSYYSLVTVTDYGLFLILPQIFYILIAVWMLRELTCGMYKYNKTSFWTELSTPAFSSTLLYWKWIFYITISTILVYF